MMAKTLPVCHKKSSEQAYVRLQADKVAARDQQKLVEDLQRQLKTAMTYRCATYCVLPGGSLFRRQSIGADTLQT